jgi:hypothetical protein
MRRRIHLLLQHTPASVVVRCRAAAPVLWLAGVRQGCPLSPLLYLFVATASARWLRADCALGIMLAGRRIVSSRHADDTKVYLPDLQEGTVQYLLQRAHRFGQAAGLFVNPLKSSAISLCGISCPTLGSSVAGVQIVGESTSLGVAVKPVDALRL